MKIGFIGLGIMGSRMAANLYAEGYDLLVFNRTRENVLPLIEKGISVADSASEVAKHSDILFTMLAHPDAVSETALGEGGFLGAMKPGSIWVDSSTVNPDFSREMAGHSKESGIRFLEAPVAGTKPAAEKGELVFMVGGPLETLEECRPFLEVMGSKVLHMGDHGMASSMKLVLNHMLGTTMLAFSEGMVFGQALGLPKDLLFQVLLGGPVVPPYIASKKQKIDSEDFETDFPLRWMQKDMHLVSESAYNEGVSMPLANVAKEIYRLADRYGLGKQDFSAIYAFLKKTIKP